MCGRVCVCVEESREFMYLCEGMCESVIEIPGSALGRIVAFTFVSSRRRSCIEGKAEAVNNE